MPSFHTSIQKLSTVDSSYSDVCPRPAEVLIFTGMTHQYFDVYECVAMPSLRFFEKIDPVWTRPEMQIHMYKYFFMIPESIRAKLEENPKSKEILGLNK